MAFSLLVVFLYGSLVWGVVPDFFPEKNISWESHLLGGVAGIVIAFAFRGQGPQKKVYEWDNDEEDSSESFTVDEELTDEEQRMVDKALDDLKKESGISENDHNRQV